MNTILISVSDPILDKSGLEKAAQIIKNGGLVAIPTETVYGLGANALDPYAVKRIFEAKGRPQDNPLIIHINSPQEASKYARDIPEVYYRLCERFSPGPLTVILKKKDIIPNETSGNMDTVAIRIPSHPIAAQIIRLAGVPIAAPSANLSGSPSPTSAKHCINDLWGKIDAIVDAGECGIGLESTVLSLAEDVPCLLRPGAVTPAQLREILGNIHIHKAVTEKLNSNEKAVSPGMKYKHYAPKASITILDATSKEFVEYVNKQQGSGIYALCFEEDTTMLKIPYINLGKDSLEHARNLFSALRELDEHNAKIVFARCPNKDEVGLAVYNRLIRAAAYNEHEIGQLDH